MLAIEDIVPVTMPGNGSMLLLNKIRMAVLETAILS